MSARVVVVEDEPMIGRILEHKLRREGHEVVLVGSAEAAEQVLGEEEGVDLAIVDATLEVDGLGWAGALAAPRRPRSGWLAMVEQRRPAEGERALELGAQGVVVKPFKPTVVAATVARLLAGGAGPR